MRVSKNVSKAVVLHSAVASLGSPTEAPAAGATGDVSAWQSGVAASPSDAEIAIDAATGTTITIGGPVDVLGYSGSAAKWRVLGTLNGGGPITVTSVIGFAQKVGAIGTYEHIQLRSGAITGGNVTVTATPIEVVG